MRRRSRAAWIALLTVTMGLAGCVGDADPLESSSVEVPDGSVLVLASDGRPVADAQVVAADGQGNELRLFSTDASGLFQRAAIPAAAELVRVVDPGNGSWMGGPDDVDESIRLSLLFDPARPEGGQIPSVLSFEGPVELGTAYLAGQEATCEAYNCGASEPVLEIASDGSVYVSGVCCVGESPPIWVSREAGAAGSFQRLEGDVLRENYGIEGDFSIDDAGNLYFTDISVASAYISSWSADGEHRYTTPAGPFAPLVDRPWTRAGAEDVVHFVYNTGSATMYYKSTDGGQTWTPKQRFEGPLGTPGQGPERDHLWVAVNGTLHESTDAGESWSEAGEIPRPSDEGSKFQAYDVPIVDEAGNVWVVYDWREGTDQQAPYHVYAARLDPAGDWHGPHQVSPDDGTHHLAWGATGAAGTLAVAWYGTLDDAAGPNSVDEDATWDLWTAASVDADSGDPSFLRTQPIERKVHEGPMNRKLLDFLQIEIGPDGRIHVAYAQDRQGQPDEATEYVRSTAGLDLAPEDYPNGP